MPAVPDALPQPDLWPAIIVAVSAATAALLVTLTSFLKTFFDYRIETQKAEALKPDVARDVAQTGGTVLFNSIAMADLTAAIKDLIVAIRADTASEEAQVLQRLTEVLDTHDHDHGPPAAARTLMPAPCFIAVSLAGMLASGKPAKDACVYLFLGPSTRISWVVSATGHRPHARSEITIGPITTFAQETPEEVVRAPCVARAAVAMRPSVRIEGIEEISHPLNPQSRAQKYRCYRTCYSAGPRYRVS